MSKAAAPTFHDLHFPNESVEYRAARNRLLKVEIALRRQTEAVAAQRRALPPGGEVREDYVFEGEAGAKRLSELFGDKNVLLLSTASCTVRQWSGPAPPAPHSLTPWTGRCGTSASESQSR